MFSDEVHPILEMYEAIGDQDCIVSKSYIKVKNFSSKSYIINKGTVDFNALFHILQCLAEHRFLVYIKEERGDDTPLPNIPSDFSFFV